MQVEIQHRKLHRGENELRQHGEYLSKNEMIMLAP